MEKVEKHLDRNQEGFYLLLLYQRISVRYGSDIVRGLGPPFFSYHNTLYTGVYKNIELKNMLRLNPRLRL